VATLTAPQVDIGALAGELTANALRRAADSIVLASDWLDEDGNKVNQNQKLEITATVLRCFDGLEVDIAHTVKTHLERAGVQTWGLPDALAALLREDGDCA